MNPDFIGNAAFHDDLAPQYDANVCSNAGDVLAREAFVDLVSQHVASGSTLLDFGCGTGLDAARYARAGYRVLAYDNSPGMVSQLEQRCSAEISAGSVRAWSEEYPAFLSRFAPSPAPSAVTTNFAVLNSIRELAPLFDTFARGLAPPGWVIVSLLNPLHWSKLRTPRWWLSGLGSSKPPVYATQPHMTYMHFEPQLLRAAPQFRLIGRANSGKIVRYDSVRGSARQRRWWNAPGSKGPRWERLLWHTPARRMLGHFVFLILRRDA